MGSVGSGTLQGTSGKSCASRAKQLVTGVYLECTMIGSIHSADCTGMAITVLFPSHTPFFGEELCFRV